MKVNVIREVEFHRINNLNNWKRTWKNLEGQGSIPSQVWIFRFLFKLVRFFIQLYNSYIFNLFSLDHCGVNQSGGNQNDADVEIILRYVYFTFYFTLVDWLDKKNQLTFNCIRISFSSFQCQKYFTFDSYQQVVLRWRFTPMI